MNGAPRGRLSGLRVLVTRSREQSAQIEALLQAEGAVPCLLPAIRFAPPRDGAPLAEAAREISRYDYALFTSANGVRSFLAALSGAGDTGEGASRLRLFAVGRATAEALAKAGLHVEDLPALKRGEGLAALLKERLSPGLRGIAIGPDPPDGELLAALGASGLSVQAIAAYRTVPGADPAEAQKLAAHGPPDAALFYSPSAVRGTLAAIEAAVLRRSRIVAVGPTTAKALREAGLPPAAVAAQPSDKDVVETLCTLWQPNPAREEV